VCAAHRGSSRRAWTSRARAFHSVPCVVLLRISVLTRWRNKKRTVQCEGDRSGICARSSEYSFLEELLAYLNRPIASDLTRHGKPPIEGPWMCRNLMITSTFISHTNKPPSLRIGRLRLLSGCCPCAISP
jgi:hypothetical protein